MANWVDHLPRKSFNTYGMVVLTLFGLFSVVVIIVAAAAFNVDSVFQCDRGETISKDVSLKFINAKCAVKYQDKFLFIAPISLMFTFNFGVVFFWSIVYGYLVKHRVEKFDHSNGNSRNNDDENETMLPGPNPGQNPSTVRECLGKFSTYFIYIIHLFIARIIPLSVFAGFFYSVVTPNDFSCLWESEMKAGSTSTSSETNQPRSNVSINIIDCTNSNGAKIQSLVYAVATVDIMFISVTLLELGYIAWLTVRDRDFMTDAEFCTVYLLRKRKRVRKVLNKLRERLHSDDPNVFQLEDDFGDEDISLRKLEDLYVQVIIQEGREKVDTYYTPNFNRHEIYQIHRRTPQNVITLENVIDVFKPIQAKEDKSYPKTILVIGRPGIGKTVLTKKLFLQWKNREDEFWFNKIVILLKFRTLSNKILTLREMLSYGDGLFQDEYETVYSLIFSNPTKAVLIFDGLDELVVGSETPTICSPNQKMSVFLILQKLCDGTFLPGSTLLITSRPTADSLFRRLRCQRIVEILGFFEEQVEQYVLKFCKNNLDKKELIWDEIKDSSELLSLCYIPVNSYIVCLTLKESLEYDKSGQKSGNSQNKDVPKTITELYKRAIKVLLYRHHEKNKPEELPSNYLTAPFPEDVKDVLKIIKKKARNGISEGKLIFQQTTGDKFVDLKNCGFFHKLPDKRENYYCFLHLTVQEFFAAWDVVDDLDSAGQFLEDHVDDPKWHLVIQFIAGLVGDKIREAKKAKQNVGEDSKAWKEMEGIDKVKKSFEKWALSLKTKPEDYQKAVIGIKCLYELQESDVIKSAAKKVVDIEMEKPNLHRLEIASIDSIATFEFLANCEKIKRLRLRCLQGKYDYDRMKELFDNPANNIVSFELLSLTDESFKVLSEALRGKSCKLTELVLASGEITAGSLEYLGDAIAEGCKLQKLSLVLTRTDKKVDEGVECLIKALKSSNCKLTHLQLLNFKIDHAVESLCNTLQGEKCKITDLALDSCNVTDQVLEYLSDALGSENCKITKLYLGGNKMSDKGVKHLSDALRSENCKITKLNLRANKVSDKGVKHLSDALGSENCKITKLNLRVNEVSDKGVKHLSDALGSENCKITKLDVSRNQVSDKGVEYLSNVCKSDFTELDLTDCQITCQGVKYISDAIQNNKCKFVKLSLQLNKIGDEEVKHLSNACKSEYCELNELDLSKNRITCLGAQYLFEVLISGNCKLLKLQLGGNFIEDEGFKYLFDALKNKKCKLTELGLDITKITDDGVNYLIDALGNENFKLTTLYIEAMLLENNLRAIFSRIRSAAEELGRNIEFLPVSL